MTARVSSHSIGIVEVLEDGPLHLHGALVLVSQVDHEVEEVALSHVVRRLLLEHCGGQCVERPVCVCVCV